MRPLHRYFGTQRWLLFVIVMAGCMTGHEPAGAQQAVETQDRRDPTKMDVHLSFYALLAVPYNRNVQAGGTEFTNTSLGRGIGAGYKAGLFPVFTHKIVGIEAETFGLGTRVTSPRTGSGGTARAASADVIAVNTLVNLLVRYPGRTWQPYVGIGAGWSSGYIRNMDIQRGSERMTGNATDLTFAYQFLGGVRGLVGSHAFVFGEYKYLVATYHWTGGTVLNFHSQLFLVGIGLSL